MANRRPPERTARAAPQKPKRPWWLISVGLAAAPKVDPWPVYTNARYGYQLEHAPDALLEALTDFLATTPAAGSSAA